jgi:hypothetical protein
MRVCSSFQTEFSGLTCRAMWGPPWLPDSLSIYLRRSLFVIEFGKMFKYLNKECKALISCLATSPINRKSEGAFDVTPHSGENTNTYWSIIVFHISSEG